MTLLLAWAACLAGGFGLWLWSLARRDVSVVDVAWGLGFVGVAVWYRAQGPQPAAWWHLVHLAVVAVWGVRLAAHIAWRGRGHGEDPRYGAMRERQGPRFAWTSLVTVFALQATLVALLSTPLLAVQTASALACPVVFGTGCALWAAGFACEAIADLQLLRFKADPASRGRVLDHGLWRYSRHPNYFGEALLWWGYGLAAAAVGGAWTLYAPLVMTVLLLKVSGVALLEKTIGSRRPGYAEYVARTSAFVPLPPRRGARETRP